MSAARNIDFVAAEKLQSLSRASVSLPVSQIRPNSHFFRAVKLSACVGDPRHLQPKLHPSFHSIVLILPMMGIGRDLATLRQCKVQLPSHNCDVVFVTHLDTGNHLVCSEAPRLSAVFAR